MELSDLVPIFVNNGVAVAVIVYFMSQLTASIQELKDCVKEVTKIYERKEGD